jgi:hypothetical protein
LFCRVSLDDGPMFSKHVVKPVLVNEGQQVNIVSFIKEFLVLTNNTSTIILQYNCKIIAVRSTLKTLLLQIHRERERERERKREGRWKERRKELGKW